jgi:hypothetical protein|tara:strand:- start:743 stop:937 length:195 start_codon:yes stop_codon:yes gene_type:complete
MKTFKQFTEQVNTIKPLSPYKVMPPMKKKDGSYNPAPYRTLVDPITGFRPGGLANAQSKSKTTV